MKKLGFILPVVLGFLLMNNQPAIADVLDNWTTTIITNQFIVGADTLVEHIVNGNGVFVAYEEEGDSGVFYSSPDGINWTRRYTDNNSWGFNLSYSGGKFVGVGVLEYAISADGTNWNVQFVPSFGSEINPYYTGTASSGSRYVMVGDTNNVGAIITSSDGTNWVYHPATTNMNNGIMGNIQVVVTGGHISSVAFGASKFVAIGQNDGYEYFASGNLSTWTRTNILGGSSIYFANGFFFVPLNNMTNLISTDGLTWSPKPTSVTNQLEAITYANGIYLALAAGSSQSWLASSVDGTNWFQYPQPLPTSSFMGNYNNIFATDGSRLVLLDNLYGVFPNSTNYARICYPLVGVRLTNSLPRSLAISGLVGWNYQIQSVDTLSANNNWRTNVSLQLPNTPYVWSDSTATNSARFYRGVLMP